MHKFTIYPTSDAGTMQTIALHDADGRILGITREWNANVEEGKARLLAEAGLA